MKKILSLVSLLLFCSYSLADFSFKSEIKKLVDTGSIPKEVILFYTSTPYEGILEIEDLRTKKLRLYHAGLPEDPYIDRRENDIYILYRNLCQKIAKRLRARALLDIDTTGADYIDGSYDITPHIIDIINSSYQIDINQSVDRNKVNNCELGARPVLFLDSWALYQPNTNEKYLVLELQEAHEKNQLIFKEWREKRELLYSILKQTTDVSTKEIISKEINAINKHYSSIENKEFCLIRDRVCKRITELCEQYAKEIGACMVIDPRTSPYPLYMDSTYDITTKILNQLNKEYLKGLRLKWGQNE